MSFLCVGLALFAVLRVNFYLPPVEDAAMLMRYSQHLADGHGIVWNIGEKPVDGATDFLFMVIVAGMIKVGISVELAVRILGFGSHVLTILIIYMTIRLVHGGGPITAGLSSAYFAVGPGLHYVAASFGTPFFALFAALSWLFTLLITFGKQVRFVNLFFVLSCLILSLIRPEGAFLSVFILISLISYSGFKQTRGVLILFSVVFVVCGGIYFLWRWDYFGYPLPNPFYKKGGGALYWSSLVASAKNAVILILPTLPIFALAFTFRGLRKKLVLVLFPILGFTVLWILLSNEMNYLGRFQYAVVPIAVMSWPMFLKQLQGYWSATRTGTETGGIHGFRKGLVLFAAVGCLLWYQHKSTDVSSFVRDGRYEIALKLAKFNRPGLTMATTEAGLLSLYSRWRIIDTWGLNDQWIAHNGSITREYLHLQNPNLIVFHATFSPLVARQVRTRWDSMVDTLEEYAHENSYVLAASYGPTPYNTHYYYVRGDFPESQGIIDLIRETGYAWFSTGEQCFNFALVKPISIDKPLSK